MNLLNNNISCNNCGIPYGKDSCFCSSCGHPNPLLNNHSKIKTDFSLHSKKRFSRRFLAELIDRLIPLPFLVFILPQWIIVVLLYHVFCDSIHSGQSIGKRLLRLKVISVDNAQPCSYLQSFGRRFLSALCQLSYCSFSFCSIAITYELISISFILLNSSGRSLEDFLVRTQVLSLNDFNKLHIKCSSCSKKVLAFASFCDGCGNQFQLLQEK